MRARRGLAAAMLAVPVATFASAATADADQPPRASTTSGVITRLPAGASGAVTTVVDSAAHLAVVVDARTGMVKQLTAR